MRTSTSQASTAEVINGLRRHVAEVLDGNGALPPAAIREFVAIAGRSGIPEKDARRVITEAVVSSSHPVVGKAVQVFGAEVVEVVAHGRA